MKSWLNQNLAEAIYGFFDESRSGLGPQLCCEIEGLASAEGVALVVQTIGAWGRDVVLCSLFRGSQWRMCAVSLDQLQPILENAVKSEEVISFMDMALVGGCTVDFSPEEGGTVELLFSAWGAHEDSANVLAKGVDGAALFRGNEYRAGPPVFT